MIFTTAIKAFTMNDTISDSADNGTNYLANRYYEHSSFNKGTNEILGKLKVEKPEMYNKLTNTFEFTSNWVIPKSYDQSNIVKLIGYLNSLFVDNKFPISFKTDVKIVELEDTKLVNMAPENEKVNTGFYDNWGVKSNTTMNVYMVTAPQTLAGWATMPGDNTTWDGMFLNKNISGMNEQIGPVIAHEFGHNLGLLHTFDGGCSGDGDWVKDTPPANDTIRHSGFADTWECNSSQNSCGITGQRDLIDNIMDYTNCAKTFTEEQVYRMMNFVYYRAVGQLPNMK